MTLGQVTFHQLELFLMAAELKNFSRAAEGMAISQPAFSAQIIKLEKILGSPLFVRIGRKVELTDAGKTFRACARATLDTLKEGKQRVDDMGGRVMGPLTLGASTTIASYLVPAALERYRADYPEGKVALLVGNTERVEQALVQNEIDMGLVEGPTHNPKVEKYLYRHDELVVVFAPQHSWSRRESVSLDEFCREPLIVREPGSGTRNVFMEIIEKKGRDSDLNIVMELGSTEAIRNTVIAGLGVAVISRAAVEGDIREGRLATTRLDTCAFTRPLTLLVRKNRYLSNPLRAMIRILSPREKPAGE